MQVRAAVRGGVGIARGSSQRPRGSVSTSSSLTQFARCDTGDVLHPCQLLRAYRCDAVTAITNLNSLSLYIVIIKRNLIKLLNHSKRINCIYYSSDIQNHFNHHILHDEKKTYSLALSHLHFRNIHCLCDQSRSNPRSGVRAPSVQARVVTGEMTRMTLPANT
ncbi:hypothetical protein E2C01_051328 [Portunus trituberculatus]|uniref:Uncharacterized protein n=1 Tax=Portunus trituberculatus TaxID=210409 RepID=A0A5B7GIL6_PORTR|nr:hypothetical protein [Portunus trituberculatus]